MLIHIGRCTVRTNIVLDEILVDEAFRVSKARTKKALIHEALKEFVENRKRLNLLNLKGKIAFAHGYDYKGMREGK
jgi:Arc/MetJ family transcription regulator